MIAAALFYFLQIERITIFMLKSRAFKHHLDKEDEEKKDPRDLVENCIYLEDSMVELFGIKIYGAPWYNTFLFTKIQHLH